MSDPVGLIGAGGTGPLHGPGAPRQARQDPAGPSFRDVFMDTLREADRLQQDATQAVEDLQTGRRDDLEGVILATQKAETAFNMIQALRNKVMQAYDEIKQMRV
ncbi:MAG TPA: flagellar hook-basal body complex protein FliE [Phycisphaerales bacterium]|nr:flagellar hook-basal body complex protein FliE [Phycisphaerales bacterium]